MPMLPDFFLTKNQKQIGISLFSRLKPIMNSRIEGERIEVCVTPNLSDINTPRVKRHSKANYPVYVYNEDDKLGTLGKVGEKTGFDLPNTLVIDTLEWLKNNQVDAEEYEDDN